MRLVDTISNFDPKYIMLQIQSYRQPEPLKNPESFLVKEGKTSVTEYLERKVATVQYLLERINKRKENPIIEPEDTLVTSFCVLCYRSLILPVDVPVCKCEFVDDLKEELL